MRCAAAFTASSVSSLAAAHASRHTSSHRGLECLTRERTKEEFDRMLEEDGSGAKEKRQNEERERDGQRHRGEWSLARGGGFHEIVIIIHSFIHQTSTNEFEPH